MKCNGKLGWVLVMILGFGVSTYTEAQQRAVQSPLVITVVRGKTDSGRRTNYDTGYSSSREYNRSVQLKISTRNMSTNSVDMKQEALFVADAMSQGSVDGIYSRSDTNLSLAARSSTDFEVESAPLGGSEYKSSYGYNYKSGSKFKGYIIRTFANGQLVDVQASQPSLQKAGWDEKAIQKMLPKEPTSPTTRIIRNGVEITPATPR